MPEPLLAWYDQNARVLPWRSDPTPYRVWISEIMLQQTRVEAARGYFERFVEALPDVFALAAVEEDALLKLWEGLGYYSRARNLKHAAQIVVERFGGRLPPTFPRCGSCRASGSTPPVRSVRSPSGCGFPPSMETFCGWFLACLPAGRM